MALYIKDRKIVDQAYTDEGFRLIKNFIRSRTGSFPIGEIHKQRGLMNVQIIKIEISGTKHFSNIIIIEPYEICINPIIDKDGVNFTKDLQNYISNLTAHMRDYKLNKILN